LKDKREAGKQNAARKTRVTTQWKSRPRKDAALGPKDIKWLVLCCGHLAASKLAKPNAMDATAIGIAA